MSHPLAGAPLCRLDEIADGDGRGFVLGAGAGELLVFVVRQGDTAYGYRNACPHQGTPLDWGGFTDAGRFVSADSGNILCATHGAEFRVEDGFCLWGPCAGLHLQAAEISRDPDGLLRFQGLADPLAGPGGPRGGAAGR
ncbi:MAG: Rieske (2Fe-2S) protein [Kiloniellaceae bacterium]